MRMTSNALSTLDTMFTEAVRQRLIHHAALDEAFDGRLIHLEDGPLLNFGSCSYLGLELDERLKEGAIEAIRRYGTQFSSSRAYVSAPPYAELEALLTQIFGSPVIAMPSTTLGHLSALPILVEDDDAVILDQQVHHSVQLAANQLRLRRIRVDLVRHSRMDLLEERLEALRRTHRRIWYLADGVYSMYGDLAPLGALAELMDRHEGLHLYLDDAHGMSWAGTHGRGTVLDHLRDRTRVVLATSLNKSFAAAGGVLVLPNDEWRRRIRTCGGPLIFAGPIQPPMLGVAVASARLHLSPEIHGLQDALRARIQHGNRLIAQHGLPVVSTDESPIRFIGLGLPRVAYSMASRLMEDGFFTNVSTFPAVPMKGSGVRFTTTLHHRLEDITALFESIARHLPGVLAAEGSSLEAVRAAFDLPPAMPDDSLSTFTERPIELSLRVAGPPSLALQHETTIHAIDRTFWDGLFGSRGSFGWEGLRFLEGTFHDRPRQEDNWGFHYYVVRDTAGRTVLATFVTDGLWKDDMLLADEVSRHVEAMRREDPYLLTTRTLAMGSMLTAGEHLYLDRAGDWKGALRLFLKALGEQQVQCGAKNLVLRDFPENDPEMDAFMRLEGFTKLALPYSMVIDLNWSGQEAFLARLSKNARRHQRLNVLPWVSMFETAVHVAGGAKPGPELFAAAHELYLNVKRRGFELNTFELPEDVFERMLDHAGWELMFLYLKPEHGGEPGVPIGVSAAYAGREHYAPMVVGLDYRYVETHHSYRSFMHHTVRRAEALGARRIDFGMGAALEKRRFGAEVRQQCAYAQSADHYHQEVLMQLEAEVPRRARPSVL